MVQTEDLFSSAYHRDEPPVRSKLDEGILLEMVSTLPARKTHTALRGVCASGSQNQATMAMNKLNSFLNRLEGIGGQDYRRKGSTRIKMLKGYEQEEAEEEHLARRRKPAPLQIEWSSPGNRFKTVVNHLFVSCLFSHLETWKTLDLFVSTTFPLFRIRKQQTCRTSSTKP